MSAELPQEPADIERGQKILLLGVAVAVDKRLCPNINVIVFVYNIACNHDPDLISRMTLRPLGGNFVPGSVVLVTR